MQKYPIGSKFLIIILSLFFIVGCGAAEKKNVAGKPTAAVTESYIAVNGCADDFKIAHGGQTASIYVDENDSTVCQIAAGCLADDIARVCGTKPAIVHSLQRLSGHVIFIGTLGHSAAIDTLAADSKINVESTLKTRFQAACLKYC